MSTDLTREEHLRRAAGDALYFLSTLLNATADEATDFLTNNGEEVEGDLREAIENYDRLTIHPRRGV